MDVNDNSKVGKNGTIKVNGKQLTQKSIKTLSEAKVTKPNVTVHRGLIEIADKKIANSNRGSTDLQTKLNQTISSLNIAESSITKIDNLVGSISGLADQVKNRDFPQARIPKLETEAEDLLSEVDNEIGKTVNSFGVEDKIREKVEKTLGESLDAILPKDEKRAFRISKIDFSTKDSIISVRTNIEVAKERINQLKDALNESKTEVTNEMIRIEVENSNRQASESSVRDLESALKLVDKTANGISENPIIALASQSKVRDDSETLLK